MFVRYSALCLTSYLFTIVGLQAYDADASGVSDVYENIHGQVLPALGDADFDGYSNYVESLFGSDPLDASDPGNLNFTVTGDNATMTIPSQIGLRYRIESKQDLAALTWDGIGAYSISDGVAGEAIFDITGISAAFFRVGLAAPLNSDDDELNDWEEGQLQTNPLLADTDGDGYIDSAEFGSGSDPTEGTSLPPEIIANAWSQPVTFQNDAAPTQFFPEFWSQPITISNLAGPVELFEAVWSAPVSVVNAAAPVEIYEAVWSAPIVVRNDALALSMISAVWSAPILVRNDFVAP